MESFANSLMLAETTWPTVTISVPQWQLFSNIVSVIIYGSVLNEIYRQKRHLFHWSKNENW